MLMLWVQRQNEASEAHLHRKPLIILRIHGLKWRALRRSVLLSFHHSPGLIKSSGSSVFHGHLLTFYNGVAHSYRRSCRPCWVSASSKVFRSHADHAHKCRLPGRLQVVALRALFSVETSAVPCHWCCRRLFKQRLLRPSICQSSLQPHVSVLDPSCH